jgi:hypothetical protein
MISKLYPTLFLLLPLATSAFAQNVQGPPFNLVLCSSDSTYEKNYLYACHTGAAMYVSLFPLNHQ